MDFLGIFGGILRVLVRIFERLGFIYFGGILGVLARIFGGDYWWIFKGFFIGFRGNFSGILWGILGGGVLKGSKRIYQSLDSLLGSLGDSLRIFSKFL